MQKSRLLKVAIPVSGKLLLRLTLLCAVSVLPVSAEWSDDPANPTVISRAIHAKAQPQITATTDGYVVAWLDHRRGQLDDYPYPFFRDVYAQKLSVHGETQWLANGRVVAEGPAGELISFDQRDHALVSDNEGGAIIQWTDLIGATGNAYITRLTYDQNVQWGIPGKDIQADDTAVQIDGTGLSVTQFLFPDSTGGAFSALNIGNHAHVVRYAADGEQRSTAWVGDRYMVSAASGGSDSVIVAYISTVTAPGVYLKKVTDPGKNWPNELDDLETEWAVYQPALVPYAGDAARIISDGAGGAFIAWLIAGQHGAVYAQKVNADGSFAWGEDGEPLRLELGEVNRRPCLVLDGAGGVVVFWENYMPYQPVKIRAQRLDMNGIPLWASGGIVASNAALDGKSPQAILSSEGNFIVVYHQWRYDLVAQKLAGDGALMWEAGGKIMSSAFMLSDSEKAFDIASDNRRGVIAAFTGRVGTDVVDKIYGARVYIEGHPVIFRDGFE